MSSSVGDKPVLIEARDVEVEFASSGGPTVRAVAGISFSVVRGETLGIVGESGCGKSTTAKAILQLPVPTRGSVTLDGQELTTLSESEMRKLRRRMQVVLQDPISSLNPRRRVRDIVAEGLSIWGMSRSQDKVREVMNAVGLDFDLAGGRLPSEFSGGQCQRISIARALALEPEILICDEPVSALDVSVQAQIINLLGDLKQKYQLTMIFVSHDLGVVRIVSDRVMVMYLGKICEIAPTIDLFDAPAHPYTRMLLDAVPDPDPDAPVAPPPEKTELPSIVEPPSGCRFRTRCPQAQDICAEEEPAPRSVGTDRLVYCHFPLTAVPRRDITPGGDATDG